MQKTKTKKQSKDKQQLVYKKQQRKLTSEQLEPHPETRGDR